jgi:hypothetical protein
VAIQSWLGGHNGAFCAQEFFTGFVTHNPDIFSCVSLCPYKEACKKGELDVNPINKELADEIVHLTRRIRAGLHWEPELSKMRPERLTTATEQELHDYLDELKAVHRRATGRKYEYKGRDKREAEANSVFGTTEHNPKVSGGESKMPSQRNVPAILTTKPITISLRKTTTSTDREEKAPRVASPVERRSNRMITVSFNN